MFNSLYLGTHHFDTHNVTTNLSMLYDMFAAGSLRAWQLNRLTAIAMTTFTFLASLAALMVDYTQLHHARLAFREVPEPTSVFGIFFYGNIVVMFMLVALAIANTLVQSLQLSDLTAASITRHAPDWEAFCQALQLNTRPMDRALQHTQQVMVAWKRRWAITPLRIVAYQWLHAARSPRFAFRCRVLALLMLCAMPFIALPVLLQVVIMTSQLLHTKQYVALYDWSPEFKLTQHMELETPDHCRKRLKRALGAMDKYMAQHVHVVLQCVARLVVHVCTVALLTIALLSCIREELVTHTHIGEQNLVWYAALLTPLYFVCRSILPDFRHAVVEKDDVLSHLAPGTTWELARHHYGATIVFVGRNVLSFFTMPFYIGWGVPEMVHQDRATRPLVTTVL